MPKRVTLEQAETALGRAIVAIENFDLPDESDIEGMSPPEYVVHKGWELIEGNPTGRFVMAKDSEKVQELEELVNELEDTLEEAYRPETSREDALEAIGEALDNIQGEDEDESGDDGEAQE